MTTRFLLVRHATCAQTDRILLGRSLDPPLDARGRAQARALARQLRGEMPARIESSPRKRTRQTAHTIAAALHREIQIEPELDELDFGDWAGRNFDDLERDAAWRLWNRERGSAQTPAGITIAGVQSLLVRHMAGLAQAYPDASVLLVTHAEVIRALLMHALRAPVDHWALYQVPPASITRMTFKDGALVAASAPREAVAA
ncbi:MAG TPA: histidine phosphatase family protein [Rhodanobacteraceae bacterium]|nr:histidine phosphatase family protein [Rhodanobacteraceae bacterium]